MHSPGVADRTSRILAPPSMRAPVLAAILTATIGATAVASTASAQAISVSDNAPPSSSPPPSTIPPTEAQARALQHYERGRAYYAVGRYRSAINELETAIALDPAGYNLFFDLGLVYERVGDADHALAAYRHYVQHVTDPAERDRAERIISRVQGGRIELQDMQVRHGRADALFWGIGAGAIGAFAAGSILLIVASRETQPDPVRTYTVLGSSGLVIGGGLAIAAAVLYFAREAPPRYAPRCLTAGADAHGAYVGAVFTF
jgi:tetratricopeptide (TPR) repeat protein